MNALWDLSIETKTMVIGVDHFGKDASTGTRGASAKEASPDTIMSILGDRDETGRISNLRGEHAQKS
jgi:hypothetical protein